VTQVLQAQTTYLQKRAAEATPPASTPIGVIDRPAAQVGAIVERRRPPIAADAAAAPAEADGAAARGGATCSAVASSEPDVAHLLARLVSEGGSDLHLHAGAAVRARIDGALVTWGTGPLDAEHSERMVMSLL